MNLKLTMVFSIKRMKIIARLFYQNHVLRVEGKEKEKFNYFFVISFNYDQHKFRNNDIKPKRNLKN